ncbi:MAG: tetratricopeptide repeat protein [Kiritimatiellae bacterium]|nr:tetratricopeptide repeat protein [Kiritimatiellia bacterium]
MKKILHILGLTMIFAPGALQAQSAREALKAGSREFADGAYDKAAAHFEEAASLAPKQKLDPAIAHYNRGNALYKMQDFAGAEQAYQNAMRTTDMRLSPEAYYNRGNSLTSQALLLEQQQPDQSIGLLDQALDMYEKSMLLKPDNSSAKANYELVTIKKKQMEEQQQQQKEQNQEEQKEDQSQQEQEQPQNQPEQNQDQQNQQPQEEQSGQDEQQEQPQPKPSDEMSKEEAEMMLDAMKKNEKSQREQIQMLLGKPLPVDKDW